MYHSISHRQTASRPEQLALRLRQRKKKGTIEAKRVQLGAESKQRHQISLFTNDRPPLCGPGSMKTLGPEHTTIGYSNMTTEEQVALGSMTMAQL